MPEREPLQSLPHDAAASVAVFLVALPISLGVALAAGAPLLSGPIAGAVGGLVVGLASRSHLSVSGPAAGLTAIVAEALVRLPSYEAFLAALVICGLLQIALGYLRAGSLADLVPASVIKGLLAAIGLILILNQLPHLVGDDSRYEADESTRLWPGSGNILSNLTAAFSRPTPVAATIGFAGLLIHLAWDRLAARVPARLRLLPAPLVVVVSGILLHEAIRAWNPILGLDDTHLVSLPVAQSPGELAALIHLPDWRSLLEPGIWSLGLMLALVASLETLLSIEAIDDLDPFQRVTPANRELKAQGLGNLVCGMVGGLPITSAIVRSSVNVSAGARTRRAAVYHGGLLLLAIVFAPAVLNLIPKATLAAILVVIGYRLAPPSLFLRVYRRGPLQFLPFLITITAILATDLLVGVLIGIGVGLLSVLRGNYHTAIHTVSSGNNHLFRLRRQVSFLNKPVLKARLEAVPPGSHVVIDASRADFVDPDIVDIIEDFMLHAPLSRIAVELAVSPHRTHGFSRQLLDPHPEGPSLIRGRDTVIRSAPNPR